MSEDLPHAHEQEASPIGAQEHADDQARTRHHGMSPETLAAASRVLGRLAITGNPAPRFDSDQH